MKNLIALTFFLGIVLSSFGQYGSIHGKIIDHKSKEGIPGVNVYLKHGGTLYGVPTDIDGNFKLRNIPVGLKTVKVSMVGYDTIQIAGVDVRDGKINFLGTFELGSKSTTLGIYTVKAKGSKLIDPEEPGKATITPLQRKKMANSGNIKKIVVAMSPGVYMAENEKEIYFRGSRNNDAIYIVDGVRSLNNELSVPKLGISRITVYSGGVPARYGDFMGGCVVVETYSYFEWLEEQKALALMREAHEEN